MDFIQPRLISFLVNERSFVGMDHFVQEQLGLLEFYDYVLLSADEPRLCLLKKADNLDNAEIASIAGFGKEILSRGLANRGSHLKTLLFFVFENEIVSEERIDQILDLPCFKKDHGITPVIINDGNLRLRYNLLRMPLSFFPLLNGISDYLKKNPPGTPLNYERTRLVEAEERTLENLDNFHKAVSIPRPYLTWFLILVNLILWALMGGVNGDSVDTQTLINYGAKINPPIWDGQLWRLVVPAFLHASFYHLVSNCIIIFFIGPILEAVLGRWRFFFLYIASALFGNLLSLIFSPYISVGASSSVFGMLGAILTYGFMNRRYIPRHFYMVISLYLIPFIVLNLLAGIWYPNLDNFAHLGGLAGGIFATLMLGVEYPKNAGRKIRWQKILPFALSLFLLCGAASRPYDKAFSVYYYILANEDAKNDDYSGAISKLKLSIAKDPGYDKSGELLGKVYANLALSYMKKDNYGAALEYFGKALKLIELTPENYEVLSVIYENSGLCRDRKMENDLAVRDLKKAYILSPGSERIKKELSEQYFVLSRRDQLTGNFASAEMNILKSLEYNKKNVEAGIFQGSLFYRQMKFSSAACAWKSVLATDPKNKEASLYLKRYIFKNLWYPSNTAYESHKIKREAVAKNSEGEKILLDTGDYESALTKFRKSASMDPSYAAPINNQAQVELMLYNIDEALRLADKSIKTDPAFHEAFATKAAVLMAKGETGEGIKEIEKCISLNPDYAKSYALMGTISQRKKDLTASEKYFRKALQLYPSHVPWRIELARIYADTGRYGLFWSECNAALALAESQNRSDLEIVIRTLLGRNPR